LGAVPKFDSQQHALQGAFSCYYSGNYSRGFRPDFKGQPSYVEKVVNNALNGVKGAIPVWPVDAASNER
jgi:type IV secretion system protein VirB1